MEGSNEIMAHLTSGALIVYAIEWAKGWGWLRWINADSKTLNRALSAGAALVIAMGISVQGDAATGWTIHVPMASALLSGGYEWVKQFMVQQVVFDGVIAKANRP